MCVLALTLARKQSHCNRVGSRSPHVEELQEVSGVELSHSFNIDTSVDEVFNLPQERSFALVVGF